MPWKVTSGPASEPLTTSQVKTWLKIDGSDEDTLIGNLITAARKHTERYTGISMITQTIQESYDQFPLETNAETPQGELRLSVSPLIAVSSVAYLDSNGDSQTVTSTNYVVDNVSEPPRVAPTFNYVWPETYDVINAVTVTYTAGHSATTDANFPEELLVAMRLWIAGLYETRQDYAKRYKDASMSLMDTVKIRHY